MRVFAVLANAVSKYPTPGKRIDPAMTWSDTLIVRDSHHCRTLQEVSVKLYAIFLNANRMLLTDMLAASA